MINFLKQAISNPKEVGAIAASSKHLARSMSDSIDFSRAESIIEFGPGTGVFTESILNDKREGTTFFSIELNPSMARIAQERCPDAVIYTDSVTNAKKYLEMHELEHCDHIVSSLPWGVFDASLQDEILGHTLDILKPQGTLLTFTYTGSQITPAARRFKKILKKHFSEVIRTRTVWRNMPPAYFYRCVK